MGGMVLITIIFNRPGLAGAVLQTPFPLINSLFHSLSHPFPPNLQNLLHTNR